MIAVASLDVPPRHRPRSAEDDALRAARTCYDHLAGHLGVALADALVGRGQVELSEDGGAVTPAGEDFLAAFLGALLAPRPGGRVFCRPCLDWSERRHHVAGLVGTALCRAYLERGWVRRREGTRALGVSAEGRHGFRDAFGFDPIMSVDALAHV